jgi:hypothetical protein
MQEMTQRTEKTLAELKQIVSSNLSATIQAGAALKEIWDRGLWKEEADSWSAFCVDNWGVSKQRAHQLIDCAAIVIDLPPEASTMVDSERAARELKKVPKEARAEVVKNAAKGSNGKVTGESVKKAVREMKPEKAPPIYDRTGFEIPQPSPAISTWMKGEEVQSMLTALSRIKGAVEKACGNARIEDNDPVFAEVGYAGLVADLQSSYQQLKVALPYAVCPTCNGRVLSPCSTCHGRGMVSEFFWRHSVPARTKEIREKAVEKLAEAKKGER